MDTVDHESQIPYYVQVIEIIRQNIKNGRWEPGDQLPSEAVLCDMFIVSRTVIRQALQGLTHDGLILRKKGKGSFIAEPKINEQLVQKLTGFYQDMVDQGYHPITKVLSQETIPASSHVASYLRVEPGTPVIEIVRLRSVQKTPIVLVTTYLPYALCPDLANAELSNQSLYALLEKQYDLYIAHGTRTIQAVLASDDQAQLLEVKVGEALFLLDSVSYLEDGTPIEYYFAYHRGDRSQFKVELIRRRVSDGIPAVRDLPPSNTIASDSIQPTKILGK
ncbi:MAG: GntR family transcriptional regulator [Aggregatilineales bacterium]